MSSDTSTFQSETSTDEENVGLLKKKKEGGKNKLNTILLVVILLILVLLLIVLIAILFFFLGKHFNASGESTKLTKSPNDSGENSEEDTKKSVITKTRTKRPKGSGEDSEDNKVVVTDSNVVVSGKDKKGVVPKKKEKVKRYECEGVCICQEDESWRRGFFDDIKKDIKEKGEKIVKKEVKKKVEAVNLSAAKKLAEAEAYIKCEFKCKGKKFEVEVECVEEDAILGED